jgi:hypothetical protein
MSAQRYPAFIIGGAPRSGTTYLATGLSRHPQIWMKQPLIPEPKVFIGPLQPPEVYCERYRTLFAEAPAGTMWGEKTSLYLETPHAPELIHDMLPDVRLLFIVREPVARAYSNYLWSRRNGLESLSFEEALVVGDRRTNPLPPEKSYARPFDYLSRSNYAALAAPYLSLFGPDRVRFLLYEDIVKRPGPFWFEIQEYLGVSPLPWKELDAGVVNSARETGGLIDPDTARELRERMRPQVHEFQELTGLDLSSWNYAA